MRSPFRPGAVAAAAFLVALPVAGVGEASADSAPAHAEAASSDASSVIPEGATAIASLDIPRDHRPRKRGRAQRGEARESARRDHRGERARPAERSRARRGRAQRRDHRDRSARGDSHSRSRPADTRRDSRRTYRRPGDRVVRRGYYDGYPPRRSGVVIRGGIVVGGGIYARPPRYRCCATRVPAYYDDYDPYYDPDYEGDYDPRYDPDYEPNYRPQRHYGPPPESERDPLPVFGFGAFAGGTDLDGAVGTSDIGLLARLRLSRSFELEGELSSAQTEDQTRLDRNLGGALVYNVLPDKRFSPYFLAGLGVTHAEAFGGAAEAGYAYGELGAGLAYRLSRRVSLMGDFRAGAKQTAEEAIKGDAFAPEEPYGRLRLGALLYF